MTRNVKERLLRVEAPHFVAGAIWAGDGAEARCVRCAPILRWMKGKRPIDVKQYLLRKGYSWLWL